MKEILLKQNFHWHTQDFETGIQREILDRIVQALDVRHVIAISGARRSGKSYLFRQLIRYLLNHATPPENILQINFEDPFFISAQDDANLLENIYSEYLSLKNPEGHIYLFFDEIQNVKHWQRWIRTLYDQNERVKIFITGSNSELLSTELASHLTGRVISFEIFPFSYIEFFRGLPDVPFKELDFANDTQNFYETLYPFKEKLIYHIESTFEKGLFPEVVYLDNQELVRDILLQYFQNVIFKDIIPRFSIRNTKAIEQLGYYLSTNFTSAVSYRKLAEAINTNENTIKEYLGYFEKTYLFSSIDYFEYSLKKQFRRNKKIYMIDNGIRRATSFSFSTDTGKYAENMVFLNLRRSTNHIYYWYEDKTYREVDFVLKTGPKPIAINITYTDEINVRELESLNVFSKFVDCSRYILVTKNILETRVFENITIEIIPFWIFIFLKFE